MTPEGRIAASIMKWLRSLPDTVAWKVTDFNNVGFPDIVGVHKGLAFFFEVKTTKGHLSGKQLYEIGRITEAGGRATDVRSLKDAQIQFMEWFGIDQVFCESIRPAKTAPARGR